MSGPGLDGASSSSSKWHLTDKSGLIPRALLYLFSRLDALVRESNSRLRYECRCSFLEIYNEKIQDLLVGVSTSSQSTGSISSGGGGTMSGSGSMTTNSNDEVEVSIRQRTNGEVVIENLTEVPITNAFEAISTMQTGVARRRVAATNMNLYSSRSHSVFTVTISTRETTDAGTATRTTRLNLVDLAGSECAKATGANPQQQKEAANINKSLSALGKVILSLVSRHSHIPYRDSKLTFLLKESFGGNSRMCLIANIAPTLSASQESLSTLSFASNARKLPNRPFVAQTTIEGGDVAAASASTIRSLASLRAVECRLVDAVNAMCGETERLVMMSDKLAISVKAQVQSLER